MRTARRPKLELSPALTARADPVIDQTPEDESRLD
jgi:hypothetical protein